MNFGAKIVAGQIFHGAMYRTFLKPEGCQSWSVSLSGMCRKLVRPDGRQNWSCSLWGRKPVVQRIADANQKWK